MYSKNMHNSNVNTQTEAPDTKAVRKILRKYFNIWKHKALKKKEHKQDIKHISEEKITAFIEAIRRKQEAEENKERDSTSSNSITNTSEVFKNRYSAQRDIILMQKSKLLEQEKLIQELQHGKISEELQNSYHDYQSTIKSLLRKFSVRTKITAGVKLVEEPEEIQMRANKVPKLVKQMERRAAERELKRKIIRERKRLIDEEKQRLIKEQIEQKVIQDEEERRRQVAAIKERRRKEVEEERKKQIAKAEFIQKCKTAHEFYKRLIKKHFLNAFKQLIIKKRNNEARSENFYYSQLKRKYLLAWKNQAKEQIEMKIIYAKNYYQMNVKRNWFNKLKMIRYSAMQNMQVAMDYNGYQIQFKVFKVYYLHICSTKIRRAKRLRMADEHYKNRILLQMFYQWKSLPAVLQLERAREKRKQIWRDKVKEILPDYQPPVLD